MTTEREFYVPPEGPPQGITPSPLIFAKMGEDNIYRMLKDFYQELGRSSIRDLFPTNEEELVIASERSAAFFVFILGGPPLYQRQFGPPMMRKRHLPFKIDEQARQAWLECFKTILERADQNYQFPMEHMESFWHFLDQFSKWMINTK